jgi:hypothetical protein
VTLRPLLALAALVAFGCAPAKPAGGDSARFTGATGVLEPERNRWTVSTTGIGPLRFGMTVAAMGKELGDSALTRVSTRSACTYVRPAKVPHGASLMISNGLFVRVDVDSAGVLTKSGIGVGDSEVSVLVKSPGGARIESNKYSGPLAHNLVVTSSMDPGNAMIFETDGRAIRRFRAGTRAAVELNERCG